jgi:PAS domain S-box-containing protein
MPPGIIPAQMPRKTLTRRSVLGLGGVLTLLVFGSSFLLPPGVAHAVLYAPVVVAMLWSPRRTDALLAGAACTLLTLASHLGLHGWRMDGITSYANVILALLAIWITAAGVYLRQVAGDVRSELRSVLDIAIEGVITIDKTGRILSMNAASLRMFGYEAGEVLGQNVRMLMPAPYREEHDGYLARYLATGQARIIGIGREVVGLRKDGSTFPFDLGVGEWSDGDTMFTASLRDLTEHRRLESEVRQAQKLEAIGRLAGGIAHDFNNLLMGIVSCCRIAEASAEPSSARAQIGEIRAASERGAALTRQLLTFSRRGELAPEPVLVDEVIERFETMISRLLGEHVELRVTLRAPHARVLIDPGQVEQVLMNLAINSRDAMSQRGRLEVRTSVVTCHEPGVGGAGGVGVGRYVALAVSDDGSGMSEEVKARAFDPFFTTKPPTEGTGLGLSMVYGIARQVGGHVHLASELGKGTTITLHLPLTEAEMGPRLQREVAKQQGGEPVRGTILVVEDDRLVRAGVRHILTEMGFTVLLAPGGADALRLCEEHPGHIDLLLTDILMPGMTGGELAREVAARLPGVRALFMSALPNDVLVEQGRIEAGQPSLQKPFSDEDLAAGIRAALGQV